MFVYARLNNMKAVHRTKKNKLVALPPLVDGCSDKATMKYLPDTLLVFFLPSFLILEGNCLEIYGLHLVVLSY